MKIPGHIKTESSRIARNMVKDAMRKAGIPIANVPYAEIITAAKRLIEQDQSIIEQAKFNIDNAKTKRIGPID